MTLVNSVAASWPAACWRDVNVLIACSGGPDSVALLCSLLAIKQQAGGRGRLLAAHFNHGLRGASSDGDERFVRRLCDKLGVSLYSGRAADPGSGAAHASEEQARGARYAFLAETASTVGARYVATGHTLDDQVETVLHRLFRGSGLAGLSGIPKTRPLTDDATIVRPVLGVTRTQIVDHLAAIGQEYRHDDSNDDQRYTRNWLRHSLLPELRERFGAAVAVAIAGLGEQAAETQSWLNGEVGRLAAGAVEHRNERNEIRLNPAALRHAPALLIRDLVRSAWRTAAWPEQAMGRRHWELLAGFIQAERPLPPIMLPTGVRAEWIEGRVVLSRAAAGVS